MEVDDVDRAWKTIKNKLGNIKHEPPFEREYGMKEIHIGVPQTNTLLFIGHKLASLQAKVSTNKKPDFL